MKPSDFDLDKIPVFDRITLHSNRHTGLTESSLFCGLPMLVWQCEEFTRKGVFIMFVKECRRCFQIKPISEFHKSSRLPNGLQTWCKTCLNEYRNEQRITRRTPEETRQYDRKNENKELVKAELKRCNKCWQVKALNEFWHAEGTGDRYADCAECRQKRDRERRRGRDYSNVPAEQKRAIMTVYHAVERGSITRPEYCSVCGAKPKQRVRIRIEFHHTNGYDEKNIFVGIFVCTHCHSKIHRGRINVTGKKQL